MIINITRGSSEMFVCVHFTQAMRSHEGNEAQVCYFIIQLLLLKPNDFRNRVSDFVKENAPEHWLQSDWHTKHMTYHKVTHTVHTNTLKTE